MKNQQSSVSFRNRLPLAAFCSLAAVLGALICGNAGAAEKPKEEKPAKTAKTGGNTKKWKELRADGHAAWAKNDFATAEACFRAAIEEAEGFGPNSLKLHDTLIDVADFYRIIGRYRDAEKLIDQGKRLLAKPNADEKIYLAFYLRALGQINLREKKPAEAEKAFLEAKEIVEWKVGSYHPVIATLWQGLANAYAAQNKTNEAEKAFHSAIEIAETPYTRPFVNQHEFGMVTSPVDNFDLGLIYTDAGSFYLKQGRPGEAEKILKKSLKTMEQEYGKNSILLTRPLDNLGRLYLAVTNYAEAEKAFWRLQAIDEKTGGSFMDERLMLVKIASLKVASGRIGEMGPVLVKALKRSAAVEGQENLYQEVIGEAAAGPLKANDWAKTAEVFGEGLAVLEKEAGSEDPRVTGFHNYWAETALKHKQFGEAEAQYRQVLAVLEKKYGTDDLRLAGTMQKVAGLLEKQDRTAEAAGLGQRQLSIMESKWGKEDVRLAEPLRLQARRLNQLNRADEAAALEARAAALQPKAARNPAPEKTQ